MSKMLSEFFQDSSSGDPNQILGGYELDGDPLNILSLGSSGSSILSTMFGGTLTHIEDLRYAYTAPASSPTADYVLFYASDGIATSPGFAFGTIYLGGERWSRFGELQSLGMDLAVTEDIVMSITFTGFDPFTSSFGDNATIEITDGPSNGTLSDIASSSSMGLFAFWNVTYTPNGNFSG